MTVMPFALIIQLVMSGMIFELEGLMDIVSYLTISRWGLDAICSAADITSMGWLLYASDEFASTPYNLLKLWSLLFFFAVLYLFPGTLFLEFVDKEEKR